MPEQCIICCEPLNDLNQMALECCLRNFHIECLHQWIIIYQNTQCPFCRRTLSDIYRYRLQRLHQATSCLLTHFPITCRLQNYETHINLTDLKFLKTSPIHYQLLYGKRPILFQTEDLFYEYHPNEDHEIGYLTLYFQNYETESWYEIVTAIDRLLIDYQITHDNLGIDIDDHTCVTVIESSIDQYHDLLPQVSRHHQHNSILCPPIKGSAKVEFLISLVYNAETPPQLQCHLISGQFQPDYDNSPDDSDSDNEIQMTFDLDLDDPNHPIYHPPQHR